MDDRMRTGKPWGCEREGDLPEHLSRTVSICETLSPSVQGAVVLQGRSLKLPGGHTTRRFAGDEYS